MHIKTNQNCNLSILYVTLFIGAPSSQTCCSDLIKFMEMSKAHSTVHRSTLIQKRKEVKSYSNRPFDSLKPVENGMKPLDEETFPITSFRNDDPLYDFRRY